MNALAAAFWLHAAVVCAQTGDAVVSGIARTTGGAPGAGAQVRIESGALIGGSRTTLAGDDGAYRFPALPSGRYHLTISRDGYRTASGLILLHPGETVRLDATLERGAAGEQTAPIVPAVEGRTAVVVTDFSPETLDALPIEERTGAAVLRLAPGIASDLSSHGDMGAGANLYLLDDLNAGDPERGAPWLQAAHTWLEAVQVVGAGADAAGGGYTGAASRSVFRAGGDTFHGLAEFLYRNHALTATDGLLAFPDTRFVTEASAQAGGPLRRDRGWFFAGAHVRRAREIPAGYTGASPAGAGHGPNLPAAPGQTSPRLLVKPTWRLSDRNTATGFLFLDQYRAEASGGSARVAPDATLRERASTLGWNGRLTRVISPSTVFEAASSGLHGSDTRLPYNGETPGWYDVSADYYSVNAPYRSDARRTRQQGQASLRRFAHGPGGAHDLSVGVQAEAGASRSTLHFPGGRSIDAVGGLPLFLYTWDGSERDTVVHRTAIYAQDAWSPAGRVRLDAGVRAERTSAASRGAGALSAATTIAPRAGLAWRVRDDGRSVVRGHYGWYDGGVLTARVDAADPRIAPVFGAPLNRQGAPTAPPAVVVPVLRRQVDAGLTPPRVKEAVMGIEHRLGGLIAGAYAIDRRTDRVVDDVLTFRASDYARTVLADAGPDGFAASGDETPALVDVYSALSDPGRNTLVISNPAGAFRTFRGLEVTADMAAGRRGHVSGSWVVSRTTGNYDGDGTGASEDYDSPNTSPALQPFRTGRVAADRTHVARVFGLYRLPFGLTAAAVFSFESGRTFTRTQGIRVNERRLDVFVEPRGSQRYDAERRLDVRLAREFRIGGARRARLAADAFNVLDAAAVTSRVTRSGLRYLEPLEAAGGRRLRLGATFRF